MIKGFVKLCKAVSSHKGFQNLSLLVIIFAGILVGIQTSAELSTQYHSIIHGLDQGIMIFFIVEIAIKMAAFGRRPWLFFKNPWNVFDFLVVAVLLLPLNTEFVSVFRLVRVFRVFRLVTALPKLQIIVGTLLRCIPSMGYVSLLLFILFYMYAVMATFLFSGNDPVHFGSLPMSFLSLFRTVTLEDWTDLMYIQMYGCDKYGYDLMQGACVAPETFPRIAPFFFVTFVMMGSMVILNLFIGVIMLSMNEIQHIHEKDHAQAQEDKTTLAKSAESLIKELGSMKGSLEAIIEQQKRESKDEKTES